MDKQDLAALVFSLQMSRAFQYQAVQEEALTLFLRKNQDYGDAFADMGVVGVMVRLNDKLKRALSITNERVEIIQFESLRDTLIDLHNYAAMGIILLDETQIKSL